MSTRTAFTLGALSAASLIGGWLAYILAGGAGE